MSLINKMLRDLDARHEVAGKSPLANGVRSLPDADAEARPRFGRGMWAFLIVAGLAFVVLQLSDFWLPQVRLLLKDKAPVPARPVPLPVATVPAQAPPPAAPAPPPALAENVLPLPPLNDALMAQADTASPSGDGRGGLKMETALAREPAPPQAAATVDRTAERPVERPRAAAAPRTARADAHVVIDNKDPLAGDRSEAEYRKGIAAFKQGHLSEAAAIFRSVLREDPRHLGARQALLGMLAEAKQWEEAQSLLKDALSIMPTHYLWAMALARIQVERGNTAAALETLMQHIAYAEKRADYQGFAGVLLQRLQRPREAAQRFQVAAQLKPSEGRWWLGLAMALEADGRPAEAREAFIRAQNSDGLTPETQAFIASKLR